MRQNLQKLNIRLLAICMAVLLLLCQMPVTQAAEYSGTCGDNLQWSFEDGRLIITGSGEMTNYSQQNYAPWYAFREEILYLSLPVGITSIGVFAFYDCYNLTAVTLPESVKSVGRLAFSQCGNMVILTLNEGLESIGRSAFSRCQKLQDLRLPNTLKAIGYHAFYRCNGLRYVTVPQSVAELDSGIFAYCENLVHVEVLAPLETVPEQMFYGCDNLTSVVLPEETTTAEKGAFTGCTKLETVYYPGSEEQAGQLKDQISATEETFGQYGVIMDTTQILPPTISDASTNEKGEVVLHDTTILKTDDATISTTTNAVVTGEQPSVSTEITATVVTQEGWQQVVDAIQTAQKEQQGQVENGVTAGIVDVNVYVSGTTEVPKDVLATVAGNKVDMTVQTGNGAKYTVAGTVLSQKDITGNLKLDYSVAYLATTEFKELTGVTSYKLTFHHSGDLKTEVMVRFSEKLARKIASLYQTNGKKLELLQSVVIDEEGYAHFYLASVNKDTDYRIGINVPGIDQSAVIIPEGLHAEYGVTDMVFASDMYVITGRTSSWGVNMTQVTIMLMAVMVVSAVAVGVFMYIRNKKKLAAGYVPDISEEDLEEE